MQHRSEVEHLDEDGYTRLDFSSQAMPRRRVVSQKGICTLSPCWRPIAVTLVILCLIMLVINVILHATGVFSTSCPPNWIRHENNCYLFRTPLASWNSSKNQCSQLHSHLLKIDSEKELEFIMGQMSSQLVNSFWIGLSRRQTEGPWLWEDGSIFSSDLFQIRSTKIQGNSSHDCVWIHRSIIYDQLCSLPSNSICEKKPSKK